MGYYTEYDISFRPKDETKQLSLDEYDKLNWEFGKALSDINGNFYSGSTLTELISCEVMKWYDHDDDMCLLSARYPDYLFILEGSGEEYNDLWKAYYWNGKMQFCPARLSFDPFDPIALYG